jgi:hypothetical protein
VYITSGQASVIFLKGIISSIHVLASPVELRDVCIPGGEASLLFF